MKGPALRAINAMREAATHCLKYTSSTRDAVLGNQLQRASDDLARATASSMLDRHDLLVKLLQEFSWAKATYGGAHIDGEPAVKLDIPVSLLQRTSAVLTEVIAERGGDLIDKAAAAEKPATEQPPQDSMRVIV